mgnify:FL=1
MPLDGQATGEIGHRVQLIEAEINGGFAAGVNLGLAALAEDETLDRFWILNPDSAVPATTAAAFATSPAPDFSMIGGRVLYLDDPDRIQIDGGTINKKTGVTNNINQGQSHADTPSPKVADMDFITGASMVVSRAFYEAAGPMPESYFLYYEEVDWALKRGDMPMYYCPDGVVYHRAGTSIGSVTPWRPAAPFSQYFLHRNRVRFVRKFFPKSVTVALGFSVAKAAKLLLKGYPVEAFTILSASFGGRPSAKIRARVAEAAQDLAFK